jgi:hypothetical protein
MNNRLNSTTIGDVLEELGENGQEGRYPINELRRP